MNAARQIFIPIYGMASILTLSAILSWLSDNKGMPEGLLLGSAVALVWALVLFIRRERP